MHSLPYENRLKHLKLYSLQRRRDRYIAIYQGWGQVQLTKYSSTPSTPNIYQVQVLVKYSFFLKVLKYIKYFHIKYKYKYKYSY